MGGIDGTKGCFKMGKHGTKMEESMDFIDKSNNMLATAEIFSQHELDKEDGHCNQCGTNTTGYSYELDKACTCCDCDTLNRPNYFQNDTAQNKCSMCETSTLPSGQLPSELHLCRQRKHEKFIMESRDNQHLSQNDRKVVKKKEIDVVYTVTLGDSWARSNYRGSAATGRNRKRNNNVIVISSAPSTVSNLTRPMFKLALWSAFLLAFNCCAQGEIVASGRNATRNSLLAVNKSSLSENWESLGSLNHTGDTLTESLLHRNSSNFNATLATKYANSWGSNSIYSGSVEDGESQRKFVGNPEEEGGTKEILGELLSSPLDGLDKQLLIKTVWDALTPEEIRSIFGNQNPPITASPSAFLKTVPNFDITKPKITHLHTTRKRRSTEPHRESTSSRKIIELHGLGRSFALDIHQNQKLLDPYFVHLHRHENRSEILPTDVVRKQLGCFYHGQASHQNNEANDIQQGAVAISLCGGLKGFILPGTLGNSPTGDDGRDKFHYVIHPLPNRLLKPPQSSARVAAQNAFSYENEGHSRHHIIFRRPGSPFSQLNPEDPLKRSGAGQTADENDISRDDRSRGDMHTGKSSVSDNSFEESTCMHHDTEANSGKKLSLKFSAKNNNDHIQAHQQSDASTSGRIVAKGELDQVQRENEPKHRIDPINLSDFYNADINDLELLTDEERMRVLKVSSPKSNEQTGSPGHHFRREKRSTSFDTETIDPFTYKPVNIAPDSYWIQFRDRGGTLRASSSIPAGSSIPFASTTGRRISSQFSYDTAPTRLTSGSGPSYQSSFWTPNNARLNLPRPARGSRYDEIPAQSEYDDTGVAGSDTTWSKGILVFDSSISDEDRHYPGKDVQFYTKGNGSKRKNKGFSTSSSVVTSTSSQSTKSSTSNTRSFDWFGPSVGINDNRSSASTRPSWNSTQKSYSLLDSPSRKGRRDEGVFGDKWKSSLDSEILWADRSNEINKQSRLNDLSNVKDRPHSHLTIETAVFVDKDLYKHMQQNFPDDTQGEVTRIVLAMINAVQLLYQDPSLGHRVDFVLKRLEVLETDPPSLVRPYDIDGFLTNFCKWQKTENPVSDADPLHWDHALILTGLDLYVVHQSGKINNQVVGLAPVAGMCTRSSSCTVNEGRHFESVFVMAHEIGHNLGMRHDGPQAENNCDPTSHIMSPTLGSGKITWSPCSKKYLDLFLETTQAKCLFDKAKSERWLDHEGDGRLPGERFDADRQCVLKYGRGSFHAIQQPLEDVCRDLHCRREFFTWTSHPALDGTRCSAADDMWCRSGKCVPKQGSPSTNSLKPYEITSLSNTKNDGFSGGSNHLPGSETAAYVTQKALDGGWGKWSPFTDCSSACLYSDDGTLTMGSNGVRLAARRCDSPRPENGGRQCSGPDRRYKSCSAHKICTKNPTRTTVSQYATEVCSRAAQVDTELTGRGYMSSSNDPERACSVWCETNESSGPRSRGWSFPDGTACKLTSLAKSATALCVAGKCQEFTCNPYSHFRLTEEDCAFSSSNDVIPSSNNKNSNSETWLSTGGVKINHRSGKVGWTDWEVQTDCKLACLAPAKGLQLVKRQCAADDALCSGLSLSVRLCKPDKYTVQSNGCSRLQTPFEYATKVCSKYSEKVSGLSGIGMQLSPTKDDTDRPCRIGCQDASIAYRFYMVNGEEGWFPAGTDCSRGDQDKKAYCMAGKCIDFGDDDTPMYQINNNVMGSVFQPSSSRNKRQAVYNIMEPLKTEPGMDESSLKKLVHKFSQDTGNFPSLVQRSRSRSQARSSGAYSVDFSRPIIVPSASNNFPYSGGVTGSKNYAFNYPDTNSIFLTKQKNALGDPYTSYNYRDKSRGRSLDMEIVDVKPSWDSQYPSQPSFSHRSGQLSSDGDNMRSNPVEGSFYEWRKIVSDCSVVCGTGIQEVIVQCVSGDAVVNDSLCQGRPRPGYSGYVNCQKPDCVRSSVAPMSGSEKGSGSHIWNWIQSILPAKNNSYTDSLGH